MMPDPANLTVPEVPAATPTAAPTATPPPSAAQPPTPIPDQGALTDADFAHPEYGGKLKNAYTGMQKAQKEAAELKDAKKAWESQQAELRSVIHSDPAMAASMIRYIESKGGKVPPSLREAAAKAAAQQGDDDDDTRTVTRGELKAWEQKQAAEFGGRDAVNDFMRAVGDGDVAKGSVIYHKDGAGILAVMDEYGFSPTPKHMLLAHDIYTKRQAASRPTLTEPAAPATSDMGRASGGAPPAATTEGIPTHEEWLRQAGFSSQADYERSLRG